MTQPPPDWRSVAHRPSPRPAAPSPNATHERWPSAEAWRIAFIVFVTQVAIFSAFLHFEPGRPEAIWKNWASEFLNLAYFAIPCALAVALLNRARGALPITTILALFATILGVLFLSYLDRPADLPRGLLWFLAGNLFQVLLFGTPLALIFLAGTRLPPMARIGTALGLAVGLLVGILVGEPTTNHVEGAFIFFLPTWGVLVVTGTARQNWRPSQVVGITLAAAVIWRALYGNLRVLPQVFTSRGKVLSPTPVLEFYQDIAYKFEYEVLLVLVGTALAFGVFPWLQKRPEGWRDVRRLLERLGMGIKRSVPADVGFGATALAVIVLGGVATEWLANLLLEALGGPTVRGVGSDFSQRFANMTPLLAILLALAAGIGEEIVFRGVLLTYFRRGLEVAFPGSHRLGLGLAILAQAVLFGIVHAGYANPIYLLAPFLFGLIMAVWVRLFGFLSAVYAHAAYDFLAFSLDAARNFSPWYAVLNVFAYANLILAVFVPAWFLVTWWQRRSSVAA